MAVFAAQHQVLLASKPNICYTCRVLLNFNFTNDADSEMGLKSEFRVGSECYEYSSKYCGLWLETIKESTN